MWKLKNIFLRSKLVPAPTALGCPPPAAEASRCVISFSMQHGSLHEMLGGLCPLLREHIMNRRIIRLKRQIHRHIYCTFIDTASGQKEKRLGTGNDVVLYSSRTRRSEFHSFCWEFIFSLTTASLYLLGITFIFDSKETSEEISFPGNVLT